MHQNFRIYKLRYTNTQNCDINGIEKVISIEFGAFSGNVTKTCKINKVNDSPSKKTETITHRREIRVAKKQQQHRNTRTHDQKIN